MKRIAFLKTLVTIAFIMCMIAVVFGLPFILILAVMPEKVPYTFSSEGSPVFMVSVLYAGHCAFTYGIYHLKTALELFSKKIFFDDRVIKSLFLTGKSFTGAVFVWVIPTFFYKMFALGKLELGLEISLKNPLILLAIGLFFIVLGDVFTNAKKLKEENDLTV